VALEAVKPAWEAENNALQGVSRKFSPRDSQTPTQEVEPSVCKNYFSEIKSRRARGWQVAILHKLETLGVIQLYLNTSVSSEKITPMAAAMESAEYSSDDFVSQPIQDGSEAFTRLEQLEQAKLKFNREKQVRWLVSLSSETVLTISRSVSISLRQPINS
jgi:hypothetical protein